MTQRMQHRQRKRQVHPTAMAVAAAAWVIVVPARAEDAPRTDSQGASAATSSSGGGPTIVDARARRAQSGTGSWHLQMSASLTETLTDNNGLASDGGRSELITNASFGVRANAGQGRLRGYFDYTLSGLLYARNTARNELQNALAAQATAELIDQHLFVDASANVSQQLISPFGAQSSDSSVANANRVEVLTYTVSPYARGRLGSIANYELRASHAATRSNYQGASDLDSTSVSAGLSGAGSGRLGWSANVAHNESDYSAGRRTQTDTTRGVLSYAITPQLSGFVTAGVESNDYLTPGQKSYTTSGFGFDWHPSPRTSLSASRERRFFGDAHAITLLHRTARTVWTFSDSRDVTTTPNVSGIGSLGTNFDLLFQQFAAFEPDPAKRRQLVFEFLQLTGIDPNAQVLAPFLTSSASLQRLQSLSFVLLGKRDTLALTASQSWTRRIDALVVAQDDLSSTSEIRQRGLTGTLSHRLTPNSSVSLACSYAHSEDVTEARKTNYSSLHLLWTVRLGPRTNAEVGARHANSSGGASYQESAVFATVAVTF